MAMPNEGWSTYASPHTNTKSQQSQPRSSISARLTGKNALRGGREVWGLNRLASDVAAETLREPCALPCPRDARALPEPCELCGLPEPREHCGAFDLNAPCGLPEPCVFFEPRRPASALAPSHGRPSSRNACWEPCFPNSFRLPCFPRLRRAALTLSCVPPRRDGLPLRPPACPSDTPRDPWLLFPCFTEPPILAPRRTPSRTAWGHPDRAMPERRIALSSIPRHAPASPPRTPMPPKPPQPRQGRRRLSTYLQ